MSLQDDINNFGSENTASDLLLLSAQTANTTNDRVISVATINDLPDLKNETIIPGTVFFVDSIQVPVVAQVGCWSGLDNRELRNDYDIGFSWAWGNNIRGQLGDGTTLNRCSPVSVVGGINNWRQVSAGNDHSLGVRCSGTLWAWGCNGTGRLGDGTTTDRSSPVSVVGGFTDWCQVSGGQFHSLGVHQNGTAWAWGCNGQGRLGDGTALNRCSPVSVVGGFTDWCQVSASDLISLGVRQNGTVWAWGFNGQYQLGDGTTTNRSSPVSVVGGFTDWCQVSAGANHSLGVRQNGTVWAWGFNGCGQLGDGTNTARSSPVSVVGGFTDWCQVSAANAHSLGVRQNGTAWAWGWNQFNQLGDGTTMTRSSPVSVVGGFTDWCQVSAGCNHSLGVRQNGTAWGWGCNSNFQLGDGTNTARNSPVIVRGGFTDWCQVSGGASLSLGLRKL
jgi:alpha-tubulin suppressor-like RCC1 family protein